MKINFFRVMDMKDGQSFVPVTQGIPTQIFLREVNPKRDLNTMCLTSITAIKLKSGEWWDVIDEYPRWHYMLEAFVVMPVRQYIHKGKKVWMVEDFDTYRKLMDLEEKFL